MDTQKQFQHCQENNRQLKLHNIQMEELEILLEVQRICLEYGINFFLTGGTLLGAVRHGGFIPWDDDIDIAMPRKDFDKFEYVCSDALSPVYSYQSGKTEKNYPYYYAKIRKCGRSAADSFVYKDQTEQGGFIDVFPLDICPDNDGIAKLFFKGMELLNCAAMSRVNNKFICGYRKKYMRFLWNLLRLFPNKCLFILRDWMRKVFGLAASGRLICNVSGRYGFPQEVCQIEWFDSKQELYFEKEQFSAPSGWNELLTNMYGDYMTLPPEEDRQGHFRI